MDSESLVSNDRNKKKREVKFKIIFKHVLNFKN